MNDLLRRFLTTESVDWDLDDEHELLRAVAERLDTVGTDARRLLSMANDVKHLIDHASSTDSIELLFELFAERERVLHVMRKYLAGTISRTGFLSFVSEQRWPTEVRQRMPEFSHADLKTLVNALEHRDVPRLEIMCF